MKPDDTEELIARYFEETITPAEFESLQEILKRDAAALTLYMDHAANHSLLAEFYQTASAAEPVRRVKPPAHRVKPPVPRVKPPARRVVRMRPKRTAWGAWAAAACAVLVASIFAYRASLPAAVVADLRFRDESIWYYETADGGRDSTNAGQLDAGRMLHLVEGSLRAVLPSGVVAVVEGPAVLRLENDNTLRMDSGRGRFSVPRPARGFAVITPRQTITDLGTEFGVLTGPEVAATEVHVFKGRTTVGDSSGAPPRELTAGHAIACGPAGEIQEIAVAPGNFPEKLPAAVEIVFADDFESDGLADGQNIDTRPPRGWTRIGSHVVGTFNPDATQPWYPSPEMVDSAPRRGVIGEMKGPSMAYIYLAVQGEGMVREIGKIEADSKYSLSFGVGHRPGGLRFGGYTVSLLSGDTVLASASSDTAPGGPGTVELATLRWDSSSIPPTVHPGDPLAIRITINHEHYLDIDNVRLVRVPKR
jgi:hypothetical protein